MQKMKAGGPFGTAVTIDQSRRRHNLETTYFLIFLSERSEGNRQVDGYISTDEQRGFKASVRFIYKNRNRGTA